MRNRRLLLARPWFLLALFTMSVLLASCPSGKGGY